MTPDSRGRSHKVGPAAKVGPCSFAVVNNDTGNFSLLVLSSMPDYPSEKQNEIITPTTPFQKRESGNFILRTFLKDANPIRFAHQEDTQ